MTNYSYWEQKTWFNAIDYAIIGSGIVGLSCALELRKYLPEAKILVFEKGVLPSGASTKNAGFACFGSLSEILDDLSLHSETEVVTLVNQRIEGLQLLRNTLGDTAIDYQLLGSFELFERGDEDLFDNCCEHLEMVNKLLFPIFESNVFSVVDTPFQFKNVLPKAIYNAFEGQIDTGKMMQRLLQKVAEAGILILNNMNVSKISEATGKRSIHLENGTEVSANHICIATNGFARQLMDGDIEPARAQVLITRPIENLAIKGTFHLDRGYYYFRNIDNRILLGGGRNLDFKAENTTAQGLTKIVQEKLETLLKDTILPNITFQIDHRWSGVMGVGQQKKPIVKELSPSVFCGVRLGGMGIAIGSTIGKKLANLALGHNSK